MSEAATPNKPETKKEEGKISPDIVVQSNKYINAYHNLTLSEMRVLEVAIVDARETEQGLNTDKPLRLSVRRYADRFNITWEAAYLALYDASETLLKKQYEYPHPKYPEDPKKNIKTNYLQDFAPIVDEGCFELTFTRSVVEEITRLNGKQMPYTEYFLEQTSKMKSVNSIRLFQILSAWRRRLADTNRNTPTFDIKDLRAKLGIQPTEYARMFDFKSKILDASITEINKKTDINVEYTQIKKGRSIVGFEFKLRNKDMGRPLKDVNKPLDENYYYTFKSEKQLLYVANLLSQVHAVVGHRSFKSYKEATDAIALELKDKHKQQQFIPYIESNDKLKDVKLKKASL